MSLKLLSADSKTQLYKSVGVVNCFVYRGQDDQFYVMVKVFPGRSKSPNEVLYLAKEAIGQKLNTQHSERSDDQVGRN